MAAAALEFTKDMVDAPEAAGLAAVLDVGVAKTVCLAARRDPVLEMHPERPLRVLGVGVQTAPAIASGKAADFDACARAIRVAIEEAEMMAGAPIKSVVACYSGPGLGARLVRGAARVRGSTIVERDIDAAVDAATKAFPSPQQSYLHIETLRYSIDEGAPIADPIGKSGKMLAVDACIVTAPTEALNALKACIAQAGVGVEDVIASPYASALSVLSTEERASGALVIDLGAGALAMSVFAAEGLVHCETVCAGGVRLTRDLAAKLQTSFAAAERVKLAYAAVGAGFDPREAVQAPRLGADGRLESATTLRGIIADTITPRLSEMLLAARERLSRAGMSGANGPQRAVLVGGGALIPGVRDLAAEVLGMPVRIGQPFELCGFDHGDCGPAYAAAAGMLRLRLDNPTLQDVDEAALPSLRGMLSAMRMNAGRAWDWLRDNF